MSLHDLNQFSFFQHTQMPAQIAVRKSAQLFEIAERQSLGIGNQTGKYAKSSALVD
jgi:hypothetical protein